MSTETTETLRFLGRMNAHISHELRNIMATISETAGLMGDLIEIGAAKDQIDHKRLTGLCERITTLVARGNSTVRDMNGLAHSMDEPVRDSDANDEAALMVAISQYAPYSREIDMELASPDGVPLRLNSLQVQHLLAELLAASFATLENGDRLPMSVTPKDGGASIVMQLGGAADTQSEEYKRAEAVAAGIAGVNIESQGQTLKLTLQGED